MQKQRKAIFASVCLIAILAVGMVSTQAFAEEDTSDEGLQIVAAESIAATITIAGTGAVAGALLSVIRVMGKHMKDTRPEGFIMSKFMLTVIVGGIVGAALGFAGVSAESAIGIDFMVVFFVSQVIYPIFRERKWKNK